jgi:5-bromo-4-chloroindolyl phosphate hydrolysis protein
LQNNFGETRKKMEGLEKVLKQVSNILKTRFLFQNNSQRFANIRVVSFSIKIRKEKGRFYKIIRAK